MADQFSSTNFDVILAGSGPMDINVQVAQALNVQLMGSGSINLTGMLTTKNSCESIFINLYFKYTYRQL